MQLAISCPGSPIQTPHGTTPITMNQRGYCHPGTDHLLQEDPECRLALRETLDAFVEAGWPAAQQLCYRLLATSIGHTWLTVGEAFSEQEMR